MKIPYSLLIIVAPVTGAAAAIQLRPPTQKFSLSAKGPIAPLPTDAIPVVARPCPCPVMLNEVLDKTLHVPNVLVTAAMRPGAPKKEAPTCLVVLPAVAVGRPPKVASWLRRLREARSLLEPYAGRGLRELVVLAVLPACPASPVAAPNARQGARLALAACRPEGLGDAVAGSPLARNSRFTTFAPVVGQQTLLGLRNASDRPKVPSWPRLRPKAEPNAANVAGKPVAGPNTSVRLSPVVPVGHVAPAGSPCGILVSPQAHIPEFGLATRPSCHATLAVLEAASAIELAAMRHTRPFVGRRRLLGLTSWLRQLLEIPVVKWQTACQTLYAVKGVVGTCRPFS